MDVQAPADEVHAFEPVVAGFRRVDQQAVPFGIKPHIKTCQLGGHPVCVEQIALNTAANRIGDFGPLGAQRRGARVVAYAELNQSQAARGIGRDLLVITKEIANPASRRDQAIDIRRHIAAPVTRDGVLHPKGPAIGLKTQQPIAERRSFIGSTVSHFEGRAEISSVRRPFAYFYP